MMEDAGVRYVSDAAIYAPNTFIKDWSARKLSNTRVRHHRAASRRRITRGDSPRKRVRSRSGRAPSTTARRDSRAARP
jgi:U3 small nucleolar ribonucleoprotein component